MTKVKVKPGKWLYLIGVLLIVVGIVAAIATAASAGMTAMQSATKVEVPGTSTVQVEKAGMYSIAFYLSSDGKPVLDTSPYKNMTFALTDAAGNSVKVTSAGKVFSFNATKTGAYTLVTAYPAGSGPSATMMVMPLSGINGALIGVLFWGFVIAGVVLIIVTAVLRSKNRKKLSVQ
ncbi:hypothetical protein [Ethanoligenens harbinense]|uniref:Uncharacterized protein n=1 Tax=Ethanoligenens harbinense (strain DSM 18485 / JCM 12961 / CGMCC 1.5033 / YUAN-3) TaxID=663278 RepID=E6U9I4_ETHHY|nr:hypothetical protein [Ethanoligenens harbinense]ADU26175.1 hypothetical protein Ethha_0601 [Ethanoligenens harbinense YUAN-3]AVQ95313.1 hypothetical protein CXQ68_03100 [Ethanoligenens harbinense YUAN-3]AYF37978.1 hypothetical protein CXP51_02965 [Ethanoligenens harbinense]AYF40724.1 hypothetical protein CN246_03100 [Ethanoligenens harbinense]QCN91557.1 hypothetical protein DRA42_03105 [Ethanoligenens harbinense]